MTGTILKHLSGHTDIKNTVIWLAIGFLVVSNIVLGLLYFFETQSTSNEVSVATSSVIEDGFEVGTSSMVSERAEYSANIGKFSLVLDPAYTIAVEVDGTFDGTSSTQLRVGRSSRDNTSVVSMAINDYVRIKAFPSSVQGDVDEYVQGDTDVQAGIAERSKTTIEGAAAIKIEVDSIGETERYVFEQNGVLYEIEAWDLSMGDTRVMLDDVIEGFSFN